MKVEILNGYGPKKETIEEQKVFLNWFQEMLCEHGLPIESIRSRDLTGGPIIIEVANHLGMRDITKSFLALATNLSQWATNEEGQQVCILFDLRFADCSEIVTVMGTGY